MCVMECKVMDIRHRIVVFCDIRISTSVPLRSGVHGRSNFAIVGSE